MVTIEEKKKLAQEIGAQGYFNWVSTKETIDDLTAMKFVPTSEAKIRDLLGKIIMKKRRWVFLGISLFLSPFWITSLVLGYLHQETYWLAIFCALYFVIISLISLSIGQPPRNLIEVKPLENWTDDLPFGALLAVKEAREKGLKCFHIHYPVNVKSDPIITGIKNGVMFQIFAWDLNKVYE